MEVDIFPLFTKGIYRNLGMASMGVRATTFRMVNMRLKFLQRRFVVSYLYQQNVSC